MSVSAYVLYTQKERDYAVVICLVRNHRHGGKHCRWSRDQARTIIQSGKHCRWSRDQVRTIIQKLDSLEDYWERDND